MLSDYLDKLIKRQDLSQEQVSNAFNIILTASDARQDIQFAAFLCLLRAKKESSDELIAIVKIMQQHMIAVTIKDSSLDIVGTGGDKAHTLNISTAASLLAASAGVGVIKHGNRSVSSKCGSADVLEALGIAVDQQPEQVISNFNKHNFGFCFAPNYHPVMKQLKSIRQALKVATTMNLLGPLLNPATPKHLLLGVYDAAMVTTIAEVLIALGSEHSIITHSLGLDEITSCGPAQIAEVKDHRVYEHTINPIDYGFKLGKLSELQGQDAKFNAQAIVDIFLSNSNTFADTVILNAGIAIYLYGKAPSIADGIQLAKQCIKSGKAIALLEQLRADNKDNISHA